MIVVTLAITVPLTKYLLKDKFPFHLRLKNRNNNHTWCSITKSLLLFFSQFSQSQTTPFVREAHMFCYEVRILSAHISG